MERLSAAQWVPGGEQSAMNLIAVSVLMLTPVRGALEPVGLAHSVNAVDLGKERWKTTVTADSTIIGFSESGKLIALDCGDVLGIYNARSGACVEKVTLGHEAICAAAPTVDGFTW